MYKIYTSKLVKEAKVKSNKVAMVTSIVGSVGVVGMVGMVVKALMM